MQFKKWFENQSPLGDQVYEARGVWLLPFKAVKKDAIEGWYIDWAENPGSVSDISKVKIGDKVADYSLNFTPYWTISGVDETKNRIYLNPIEPNPFVTGKGAGGKVIDQHDMEVHSGEYEKKRVDAILQTFNAGLVSDISDVVYILLGTVPVNFGPNGSQGGWYNVNDINSNRGGQRGMSKQEIMVKDAQTLQNVFRLSVPKIALTGTLDTHKWNDFIQGQTIEPETEIEGENLHDVNTCVKMILKNTQPSIKLRNVNALLDLYSGYGTYRQQSKKAWAEDKTDLANQLEEKWFAGGYTQRELEPLIKKTAIELANVTHPGQKQRFDPYWHAKEKFIDLAAKKGWSEVLVAYETTNDITNRRHVFWGYLDNKQFNKAWGMLERANDVEELKEYLGKLFNQDQTKTFHWIQNNEERIKNILAAGKDIDGGYHNRELEKTINMVKRYSKK
jgi:hypothetical protein